VKQLLLSFILFLLTFSLGAQDLKLGIPVGHNLYVNTARFSPNEKLVLTSSNDGTIRIWDYSSGKQLKHIILASRVFDAKFSPNGKQILSRNSDGKVQLFETETGNELDTLKSEGCDFLSANFSPNGKYIAAISRDFRVFIWSSRNGKLLSVLEGHRDRIRSLNFSSDGAKIVTSSDDSTAMIWDVQTGTNLNVIDGHVFSVYGTEFSPDDKKIVTSSGDMTASIWDVKSGRELHRFMHDSWVADPTFSPNGKELMTVSGDQTVRLWNTKTGKLLNVFDKNSEVIISAVFSPNGENILIASHDRKVYKPHIYTYVKNNIVRIFNKNTGELLHNTIVHSDAMNSAFFSPTGDQFITSSDDHTACIWETISGAKLKTFKGQSGWLMGGYFGYDDKLILADRGFYREDRVRNFIDIIDTYNGKHLKEIESNFSSVASARFNSDNSRIITCEDSTACIYYINGEKLYRFNGHSSRVNSAIFSHDNKLALTASADSTVKIWNTTTGDILKTIKTITQNWTAKFSPDDKSFVVGSWDSIIRFFDTNTGKLIKQFNGHRRGVNSVEFSADGKYILTGSFGFTTKIFDVNSGEVFREFKGSGDCKAAVYSPDDKYVAITSENDLQLWEIKNGKLVYELKGHSSQVTNASFSHNGRYLISSSWDGSRIIWDISKGLQCLQHFFFDNDPNKWVHLHPSGLFDASPEAMDLMYWTKGLEVIEFSQLKDRYWLPGLWEKVMSGKALPRVQNMQELKLYPEVAVNTIDEHTLSVDLIKRDGGYGAVKVLLNGKEISQDARGDKFDPSKDKQTLKIDIKDHPYLKEGENKITVIAASENGINSRGVEQTIFIDPFEAELPNFYAVVIGVGEYANDRLNLKFATKDAEGIAKALKFGADGLFPNRNSIYALTSNSKLKPSKTNIEKVFTEISKTAKSKDVILLYMAGHGISTSSESGEFYFLTKDAISTSKEAYLDEQIREANTISTNEWVEWLKKIPALKQVMIIDACGSGKAIENLVAMRDIDPSQIRAIDRMKDRTGMYIISGCAADAVSYEASQYGQGLLTFSILQGMKGAALKEGQFIDVENLLNHARESVPVLAEGIGGIQTPQLLKPKSGSFDIGILNEDSKSAIPLANPKTVFVRSSFVNSDTFEDNLDLSQILDERLILRSARGSNSDLVYFDVRNFPNACKLSGGYTKSNNQIDLTLNIRCGENLETHALSASTVDELCNQVIALVRKSISSNK